MSHRVKTGLKYVGYLIAALIALMIVKVLTMALFFDRRPMGFRSFKDRASRAMTRVFSPNAGVVQEDRALDRFELQRDDPTPNGVPRTYNGDVTASSVMDALRALNA